MIADLKVVLYEEKEELDNMINLLDVQLDYILKKDIKNLNKLNKKLESASRNLATIEIKRRQIIGEDSEFIEFIEITEDDFLKNIYREIKILLKGVSSQQKFNVDLIKKELNFTKRLMEFMKPKNSEVSTYNAKGQISR
ncbi:flagellar protein FlgN [Metaclostridioides mangenotii]|uniref:Flagellar biosynthesis/type III secretory pathway chaperone n=1 Tax=Metaclostridioides mangenotii TaxID=1540 RepID=A0ABS4ECP4_9FIRM|nr:flagellar protein FlgN [Clostridioides mangenotii]MBP1855666.1 flagellar biosynthesis/type III secretory pathway chaperone [Clostridioides mangenotii]